MTEPARLEVWFDYRSPFAYVAAEVLPGFAASHGLPLDWRPVDIMQLSNYAAGLPYSEKKRTYVAVDAARTAAYHGVEIRVPKPHPVDSLGAMRLAAALLDAGDARFAALHRALYRAAWRDRRDLGDDETLRACIAEAGGPVDAWLGLTRDREMEEALAASSREAEAKGVFGVPSMWLGDEQFWGIDSLPVVAWRLEQAAGATPEETR